MDTEDSANTAGEEDMAEEEVTGDEEGMEDEDMKKETQNLAYPPAFKVTTPFQPSLPPLYFPLKLEVALFAKKHSQYAAAKIFNVARRRIFDWMRQVEFILVRYKKKWRPRIFNTS